MEPVRFVCEKVISLFSPRLVLCLDDYPGVGYAFSRPPLEVVVDTRCPDNYQKVPLYFSPYTLCQKVVKRPVILTYKKDGKMYDTFLEP